MVQSTKDFDIKSYRAVGRHVSLDERTFVATQSKPDSNVGRVRGYQNWDSSGQGRGRLKGNYCANRSWGARGSYSNG